jgi:hypothetical protein
MGRDDSIGSGPISDLAGPGDSSVNHPGAVSDPCLGRPRLTNLLVASTRIDPGDLTAG